MLSVSLPIIADIILTNLQHFFVAVVGKFNFRLCPIWMLNVLVRSTMDGIVQQLATFLQSVLRIEWQTQSHAPVEKDDGGDSDLGYCLA